jgi:hypothetical protein
LADSFANPLVVQALMMSRDGTFAWDGPHNPPPDHGCLDNPTELEHWDPWVRTALVQAELNEGLSFALHGPDTMILKSGQSAVFSLTRPSPAFFAAQLPLVQSWATLREERMAEVLTQIDNQVAFIAAITGLKADRHRWTWEWLAAALSLVIPVEVRFKHALACRRPVAYSPQVQAIITTPGHGTYPMGHAAQIYVLVEGLKVLLCLREDSAQAIQLNRLAERVSVNRVVAGVHFPIDAHAGKALGLAMARYFLGKCGLDAKRVVGVKTGFGGGLADPTSWDFPAHSTATEGPTSAEPPPNSALMRRLTQLALRELHVPCEDKTDPNPCQQTPCSCVSVPAPEAQ